MFVAFCFSNSKGHAREANSPSLTRSSRIKTCAFHAFRVVRYVQGKAGQVPGALKQVGIDIAAAWRKSSDTDPNRS
jgi:hypothetical protein